MSNRNEGIIDRPSIDKLAEMYLGRNEGSKTFSTVVYLHVHNADLPKVSKPIMDEAPQTPNPLTSPNLTSPPAYDFFSSLS
jgi:hypothetical protein